MSKYSKYIGLKYKCRGRGPDYYDCYGLCRIIYAEFKNINLPDFLDVPYKDEWYKNDNNYIVDNIMSNWIKVDKPYKRYDLIVLYNGTKVYPNHVGVWVNNKILHIYEGTTSRIDRYEGYWESKFYCALRWKNNG